MPDTTHTQPYKGWASKNSYNVYRWIEKRPPYYAMARELGEKHGAKEGAIRMQYDMPERCNTGRVSVRSLTEAIQYILDGEH